MIFWTIHSPGPPRSAWDCKGLRALFSPVHGHSHCYLPFPFSSLTNKTWQFDGPRLCSAGGQLEPLLCLYYSSASYSSQLVFLCLIGCLLSLSFLSNILCVHMSVSRSSNCWLEDRQHGDTAAFGLSRRVLKKVDDGRGGQRARLGDHNIYLPP